MPKQKEKSTTKQDQDSSNFRGLTIFELLLICLVIGGVFLWGFGNRSKLSNQNYDSVRKGRVSAIKENLRYYYLKNNTFPSEAQFQDTEEREAIFSTFIVDEGKEVFFDPQKTDQLATYIAEPEGCTATEEDPCTKVSISFTLSNGDEFYKFAFEPGKEVEYFDQLQEDSTDSEGQEQMLQELQSELEAGD